MKKISVLFVAMLLLLLTACGSSGKTSANITNSVSDVLQQQMNNDSNEAKPTSPAAPPTEKQTSAFAGNIDVDLTEMSSTMVYSEVYSMITNPDEYMNKSVKVQGNFAVYHDEATDKYYYACIVADATACCSQGLEFVLSEARSYPEEYPELGSDITVVGIFDTYMENGLCIAS